MEKPDDPKPQAVRRWDLREAGAFRETLRRQPRMSLVLALLCLGGSVASASGWFGESAARGPGGFRRVALATAFVTLALYFGTSALAGWRERGRPDE